VIAGAGKGSIGVLSFIHRMEVIHGMNRGWGRGS